MKVTNPDLDGRLLGAVRRVRMLQTAMTAMAYSQVEAPNREGLAGLGEAAEEVADELQAIYDAYCRESNARDEAIAGGAR